MKTIKISDIVYHLKGEQSVQDGSCLVKLASGITDTICFRDPEKPKFGEKEREVLSKDYSVIYRYIERDSGIYIDFKTKCVDIVVLYLLDYLDKINQELNNISEIVKSGAYFHDIIVKSIDKDMCNVWSVISNLEKNNLSLTDYISYINTAFGLLDYFLIGEEDRVETGKKYIFFISKLRDLCMDVMESITIDVY